MTFVSRAQMSRYCAAFLLLLAFNTSCGGRASQPAYQLRTLSSGRTVKILAVGRINFPESGPALMLRYQTDVAISDTARLRQEAEDIWHDFQPVADSARVSGVVLSANSPPSGGLVSKSEGYNFVYERAPDGTWRLGGRR